MHREVFPQWSRPTSKPCLAEGRIDVWRITPTPGPGQRASAHSALREILCAYLGCSSEALEIKAWPGGKPYLGAPDTQLEFNLSHSRDIALVGVTSSLKLGIDVETHRAIHDPLRLARRVMTADECVELDGLPEEQRLDRFLTLWTRLEARQKAMGLGVFAQAADPALLSGFSFRPGPDRYASLCVSPATVDPDLRFFDFSPL